MDESRTTSGGPTGSPPVLAVDDVLRRREELVGGVVTVEGFLVVAAAGAYLLSDDVPDDEAVDGREHVVARLAMPEPDVADGLLAAVPPYVGGSYMYRDHAVVVATVCVVAEETVLVHVRHLVVTRLGTSYRVEVA